MENNPHNSILYDLDQVCHYYGDKKVLDIKKLQIPRGSILGLSGANGSGKSTLLKLLAFAMGPTRGRILFNNHVEYPFSPRIRSKVTLLTQTPYLLKRSVIDNVVYGLKIRKDTKNLKKRAAIALDAVGLDFDDFHKRSRHELSGGEAQRVAMAARLILKPRALLLDEPVASVDTQSASLIRKASLAARNEWGCTLVIASHDLTWLNGCSDTRISIEQGRIFSPKEESIIPPPYTTTSHSHVTKEIGLKEIIRLPAQKGGHAVIARDKIELSLLCDHDRGDNQIKVKIIQMVLDQKTNNVLTSFATDNFSITLILDQDQVSSMGLAPGKEIVLIFCSKDINWR